MAYLAFSSLFFSSVLLGEEKDKAKAQDEVKPGPLKDEPKVERVAVPAWLSEENFRLIVDNKDVDLSAKDVEVKPSLDPVPMELYDRHGRLVDFGRDYYDRETFNSLRVRSFRIELMLGSVHPSNDKQWRKVFLSGDRFVFGGNFEWYFSNFGVGSSLIMQSQTNQLTEGAIASYTGVTLNVDALYELVPLRRAGNYFRKISLTPLLGIGFTSHRLKLSDDVVSQSATDETWSYRTGVGVRFPLANNFSLQTRYTLVKQKINFDKFATKIDQMDHGLTLGGAYAL